MSETNDNEVEPYKLLLEALNDRNGLVSVYMIYEMLQKSAEVSYGEELVHSKIRLHFNRLVRELAEDKFGVREAREMSIRANSKKNRLSEIHEYLSNEYLSL